MDLPFQSGFNTITTVAVWTIAGVIVTTVLLFFYTVGLRYATTSERRRRNRFLDNWRDVFAAAALSEDAAHNLELPQLARADYTHLLEEWNLARSIVFGAAARNLITLAGRVGVAEIADSLLEKHRVHSQIVAVQTFGHLGDVQRFDDVHALLDHPNTALSITAATSLVEIRANRGIEIVMPMIARRRDWPRNKVSVLLREAGSDLISEPMYRAIRAANDDDKKYLMQFARLMESEVRDAVVEEMIRESEDPGLLTAALKLVSGYRGVPRIVALTQHEAWFVRMQAAKVLGRIGQREHLSLLESLLEDSEWWVRYRAAQAISSLPFLGPNELRQLQKRQKDRYAVDILQHSFAEVGLV